VKLTDEAVEAALDVLFDHGHNGIKCYDPRSGLDATVRTALEAALPHLTDDGAALPVRRDGEGGLAAAPSSPHLEEIVAAIEGERLPRSHIHNLALGMARRAVEELFKAHEGATPTIDRDEIQDAIYKALPGEITWHESLAAADAVIALIGGPS
jgi:hypothetical protein